MSQQRKIVVYSASTGDELGYFMRYSSNERFYKNISKSLIQYKDFNGILHWVSPDSITFSKEEVISETLN